MFGCLAPSFAQTAPSDSTAAPSTPAAAQAPDEMTKKITDLVNAGKYTEAQQLTTGLLVAFPDDQRLIKTKSLLEKLLAPASSTEGAASTPLFAHPAVNAPGTQLTGMDKVDYDSLIELGREAQQATDLGEQKKLLLQFMDKSGLFLQKHPEEMLLWQLRAAGALSLDGPLAGYQAGQKLLAAGAANSADPNVAHLLAQLNLKGWMDRQEAERQQAIKIATTPHAARSEAERSLSEAILTVLYANNVAPVNRWKVYGFTADSFILSGQQGNDPRAFRYDQVRTAHFFHQKGYCYVFLNDELNTLNWDKSHCPDAQKFANALSTLVESAVPAKGSDPKTPKAKEYAVDNPAPVSKSMPEFTAQAAKSPVAMNDSISQPATQVSQSSVFAGNPAPAGTTAATVANTAILHLYRLRQFAGLGLKTNIDIDGKKTTQIANGQAIQMLLAPGKHNIAAPARKAKADHPIYDLDMEAGKEYWVRIDFSVGFLTYVRLYLEPDEKAQTESGKLEEIKLGDLSTN